AFDHCALGLNQPALAQMCPFGNGGAEGRVFFGHSRSEQLSLRAPLQTFDLPLCPTKLAVEQRTLDLESGNTFQILRQPDPAREINEPLRWVPLPPLHPVAKIMRECVMEVMVALTEGQQRHQAIVARGVCLAIGPGAPEVSERIDEECRVMTDNEP